MRNHFNLLSPNENHSNSDLNLARKKKKEWNRYEKSIQLTFR